MPLLDAGMVHVQSPVAWSGQWQGLTAGFVYTADSHDASSTSVQRKCVNRAAPLVHCIPARRLSLDQSTAPALRRYGTSRPQGDWAAGNNRPGSRFLVYIAA